eukprot:CAMPEP_0206598340 /NCGR_PEP_ID=MMETSP0325_2-20121206/44593_1 /ASSEMBLY_ACC=CAM_ASM_000347 /TAXON_ID=2866 /ORGANISM="Crypthecodinium cohnii, Strain Seligo" /LENGTH=76 /DNA_ID=CAMNT_0054109337 /DNA_START=390 /DNA_END=616 /DNA_ORIENTATION=+
MTADPAGSGSCSGHLFVDLGGCSGFDAPGCDFPNPSVRVSPFGWRPAAAVAAAARATLFWPLPLAALAASAAAAAA